MGVDIYMRAEVRKNGAWHLTEDKLYDDRNYRFFAMLDGTRNDREYPINPIASRRGFPLDAAEATRKEFEYRFEDGWGSWLTLKEIEDYDWNQCIKVVGIISFEDYEKMIKEKIMPNCWWADQSSSYLTEEEANKIIDDKTIDKTFLTVKCQFLSQPYSYYADDFLLETLPVLRKLGKPEDVRIIFSYDC